MPATPEGPSHDTLEPAGRPRRLPLRLPLEEEAEESERAALDLDPDRDLPGAVFMVPNRHWGFESSGSADHPGVCVHLQTLPRTAILVKGTDVEHVRGSRGYYIIVPTRENGLLKETAFELVPRYFRLHRLRLFYPERHLGRLGIDTLHALCEELARLYPLG